MKRTTLVVAAAALGLPSIAAAGGFQVYEQGAAATGMVGSFTAKADDPSAIFYNPAGLAAQKGWQVYVGGTLVVGAPEAQSDNLTLIPGGKTSGDLAVNPLPTLYLSYGLGDLAFGVGAFTQFGLAIDWHEGWAGRLLVENASLQTATINPTVAWRPVPWLSLGAGLGFTRAAVELERRVDLLADEADLHFSGEDWGLGANVGARATWGPWSVGLHYRTGYDLGFDGGTLQMDAPPELSATLRDRRAETELRLPGVLSLGIGLGATSRLYLHGQLDWIDWSRFDTLVLEVPDAPEMSLEVPQRWDDGWTARLAGEVTVRKDVRVRAGVGYDWSPVPAETLGPIVPDSDRWFASVGGSFPVAKDLSADVSLMGVFFRSRQSELPEFPVEYDSVGALAGVALRYAR